MSTLNDNKLHADPGIEAHEPHHEIPVTASGASTTSSPTGCSSR